MAAVSTARPSCRVSGSQKACAPEFKIFFCRCRDFLIFSLKLFFSWSSCWRGFVRNFVLKTCFLLIIHVNKSLASISRAFTYSHNSPSSSLENYGRLTTRPKKRTRCLTSKYCCNNTHNSILLSHSTFFLLRLLRPLLLVSLLLLLSLIEWKTEGTNTTFYKKLILRF